MGVGLELDEHENNLQCWQEWSVHGEARQVYESRWQHFVSRTKGKKSVGKLTYGDVPWPADEGCSADNLQAILLSGTKVILKDTTRLLQVFDS
jgi:hypothetical protein